MRYVHLVTWPNLSMLASTTGPHMFEKQAILGIVGEL